MRNRWSTVSSSNQPYVVLRGRELLWENRFLLGTFQLVWRQWKSRADCYLVQVFWGSEQTTSGDVHCPVRERARTILSCDHRLRCSRTRQGTSIESLADLPSAAIPVDVLRRICEQCAIYDVDYFDPVLCDGVRRAMLDDLLHHRCDLDSRAVVEIRRISGLHST